MNILLFLGQDPEVPIPPNPDLAQGHLHGLIQGHVQGRCQGHVHVHYLSQEVDPSPIQACLPYQVKKVTHQNPKELPCRSVWYVSNYNFFINVYPVIEIRGHILLLSKTNVQIRYLNNEMKKITFTIHSRHGNLASHSKM